MTDTNNTDKLTMHTPNLVDGNIAKLAELFPNVMTESQDEHGNISTAIDFELLKQELSHSVVDGSQERYRLDWVGKRQSILEANTPIAKTLRPVRAESVNFDGTENLFIEGDNLEALKLLQESYLGKVKMIYIDPPYNTGNDFIYEDDFSENTEEFLERSNQVDEDGNRLVANTESNGRFHSDWLTMMYSRLKLARNLLSDDGVIFISCDDNEVDNLKKLGHEVFGQNNFSATIVWQKKYATTNDAKGFSTTHDYIICFQKSSKFKRNLLPRTAEQNKPYKNDDKDGKGLWRSDNLLVRSYSESGVYPITNPNTGKDYYPAEGSSWRASQSTMTKWLAENRIYFGKDGKGAPQLKRYLNEVQQGRVPMTWWTHEEVGHNDGANKELKSLFETKPPFDTPKPSSLIRQMLMIGTNKNDLILDFFAGSSTTAHAVMDLNAQDGGNRKFIMVQITEKLDENNKKQKDGYKFCIENNLPTTIAEISKERIRRAGNKILADNADKEGIENLDIGFRVLKIDSTNMNEVYYTPDQYSQELLDKLENNIKADRTAEDLLFQVMLDWGVPLSLPITSHTIAGQTVYSVGGNSLVACFDEISTELVAEVAKLNPLKFVSCETAIVHDEDKSNIKERFKQLSKDTDVKFI